MKKGFTLIEVLVASLLLGVLVSMLTSLFTQSSIAWSAGTAMVSDLGDTRRDVARYMKDADAVLDSRTVVLGVFKGLKGATLNDRAAGPASGNLAAGLLRNPGGWSDIGVSAGRDADKRAGLGSGKAFVVGVTSWGPDGIKDTWDDITTWPAEED